MKIARIALDIPSSALFDYRADEISPGDIGLRALVPFGNRHKVGVIAGIAAQSDLPPEKIKALTRILRDVPPLPPDIMELLRFCSDYYRHPLGEVVMNALPAKLRQGHPLKAPPALHYRLTAQGLAAGEGLPPRAALKRRLWARLREGVLARDAVRAISPRAAAALRDFIAAGWVEEDGGAQAAAADDAVFVEGPPLTPEQAQAEQAVRASSGGFQPWLLHGVTGSGKTEVYFRIIADALRRNRQTLLLVPEINLTPQFEALFRARFPGTALACLHSGLNDGERLQNWLAAQAGKAQVVLGTRLAVFTPLPRLGLIIVDEEHDGSFKQQDGLRYSARDLAVFRAKQSGVPIVLGSATPSLESYFKARSGRYRLLALSVRANAQFPEVRCIDARRDKPVEGFTQALRAALKERLRRGEQSLVFINRRGYSPVLMCHACGWAAACRRCSARLVLHLRERRLRCHHCGCEEPVAAACPACGNQDLAPLGHGTQRVEDTLAALFPAARILRIDRDTTRGKRAWSAMRERIQASGVDILVGTQLLAKGHDFPRLSLVGILNADGSLYSTDFRASERLFSQLMQVAGRAGRAEIAGEVLIQTEFSGHPLFQAVQRHDYPSFAEALLAERRQAGFPPFVHQALLRAEAPHLETALEFLTRAAQAAREIASQVSVYDPVPATMRRLAGKERAHLLVQAALRSELQGFLRDWCVRLGAAASGKVRWALDVDPQEF